MMGHWIVINVLAALLLVLGLISNSAAIYVFGWKKRFKRSKHEFLLLILGIVDLICSVSIPVILLSSSLGGINYETYFNVCKVAPVVVVSNVTVSQCILILICYDRYRVIVKPFERQATKKQISGWVAVSIILATVATIPLTMVLDFGETEPYQKCLVDITGLPAKISVSVIFVIRDMAAVVLMLCFMRRIMKTLNASQRFRAASIGGGNGANCYNSIRKVLVNIIIANSFCIVPMDTFKLMFFMVVVIRPSYNIDWNFALVGFTYLQLLQILNSVVNGFVYAMLHPDFASLRNRLCPCRKQKKVESISRGEDFNRNTIISRMQSLGP